MSSPNLDLAQFLNIYYPVNLLTGLFLWWGQYIPIPEISDKLFYAVSSAGSSTVRII